MQDVLQEPFQSSGEAEAIILIKAAPHISARHGETVCCAGLDIEGRWLRLFPVAFRRLEDRQKFRRWDRIRFRWRKPKDDTRAESRRVEQESIEIVGSLKSAHRLDFVERGIVTSLERERRLGRSLALLRAEIREFIVVPKAADEIEKERSHNESIRNQGDLFANDIVPLIPCPYKFKYRYRTDDGDREGTCQDWETETTYFRWVLRYGEQRALSEMQKTFGEKLPKEGMLLAMGTHSLYPEVWLINGVVQHPASRQMSLTF